MIQMELVFAPFLWTSIEKARNAIAVCLGTTDLRGDVRETITIVSLELLENAVKHGAQSGSRVTYRLERESEVATVRVTNSRGSDEDVDRLTEVLSWLDQFDDSKVAYSQRMLAVAQSPGAQGGLGLARVAAEGPCTLACKVDTREVTVEAYLVAKG